ncbi:MAG TPA: glycosyltransferase family 9 protein [Blastocatellia bacterium]|nr:glycosyltransferase family 9 protein [Blastocatellia bacterium]
MTQAAYDVACQGFLPDWTRVRRVLLIRLRSIGDTVLMTPCLAALKSWKPDIEISVLTEPLSAPLLEDHPMVDRLIIAGPALAARARLALRLRSRRFDVAFNLHGGTTGMFLARLSGARQTIAFRGHRQSWLMSGRAPSPDVILGRARIHSVEQQLALLHWAGVPWPERPVLSLALSSEAKASVAARLDSIGLYETGTPRRFALIAPSAAMESKRWTAAGFAAVADHLNDEWGLPSLVVAGPGQEGLARSVSAASHAKPAVVSGLSLKELMALAAMSEIFVGNDSGPAHIAAAFARPLVVIFGTSNSTLWRPWTESAYRVVRSESREDRRAIKRIPAEEVKAAVDEILQLALEARHRADASSPVNL